MKEFTVDSPAFENEGLIPIEYTGYGSDISPVLRLHNTDSGAKSIAVVMDDLDHPIPGYNHWVIWNIPVMDEIPENIPHGQRVESLSGAMQGVGYGKHRYRGPKPPFHWSHRYRYSVFVLDCVLDLPERTKKRGLMAAMQGHVLQQAVLFGHYR